MRFKRLDLNLLVALDLMLRLQSISRAAEQMNMSQSAMSNALTRLRQYFDDPLLVQVGRRLELTPRAEAMQAVAEAIGRAAGSRYGPSGDAYSTRGKPVIACFMGDEVVRRPMAVLHEHRIASYIFPEQAARAMGALWRYAEVRGRLVDWETGELAADSAPRSPSPAPPPPLPLPPGPAQLGEAEARPVLAAYGIAQPRAELARSAEEAGRLAAEIGFPVALKIVSPDIFHKSEVGGIALKLGDEPAVQAAFTAMLARVAELRGIPGRPPANAVTTAMQNEA